MISALLRPLVHLLVSACVVFGLAVGLHLVAILWGVRW